MIVPCPHCQRKLTIEDSLAGKRGVCAACKQPFDIPPSANGSRTPKAGNERAESVPKPPPIPPPIPKPRTAGPAMPGTVGEPLPGTPKAGEVASGPPLLPKVPPTPPHVGADAALNHALVALGKSFSLRKLGFFLIGGTIIAVVVLLMVLISARLMTRAKEASDVSAAVAWLLLTGVVVVGLLGVVAGGVAHLTTRESQGAGVRLADAFRFCRRRFLSLFVSLLLLVLALVLAVVIANGAIWLVYKVPTVGKPLAALLFLPQVAVNLVLIIAALSCVLLPCIIAVDDAGLLSALARLGEQFRLRLGALMGQLGLSIAFVLFTAVVTALLATGALGITHSTNSLSSGLGLERLGLLPGVENWEAELDKAFRPRMEEPRSRSFQPPPKVTVAPATPKTSGQAESEGLTGDSLRLLCMLFVYVCALAIPAVYWVVSFTEFYRAAMRVGPGKAGGRLASQGQMPPVVRGVEGA